MKRATQGSMLALLFTVAAHAEQVAVPLVQGDSVVSTPPIGRVVLVFLVVAGLAVAISVLLRRTLPKLGAMGLPIGNVQVTQRMNLGAGLRIHVIQVEGEKILLAESRHGLALTVLNSKARQPE